MSVRPVSPRRFLGRSLLALLPLLLVGVLPEAVGAPPAAEAGTPAPLDASTRDFDQLHLDIHVTPDLEAGSVRGRVTIRFASLVDGLRTLRLHSEETRVGSVRDGEGRVLAFRRVGDQVHVDLLAPLAEGEEGEVTLRYLATPTRGLYFHQPCSADPDVPLLVYSQGEGTDNRRWIPCYDEPDDRMQWDLYATVPDALQTVSNGAKVEETPAGEGLRTDHWRWTGRAPSYLISLVAGPLQTIRRRWNDVTLEFNAPPGHEEELVTALGGTTDMLGFYGEYLGVPYPWKRYAQTFVWDFVYGGMENVTATTLNMRALHTEAARPNYRSEALVAHELAHMWFGDLLTCRTWDHIWLNEGFATYFTDLYFEHRFGREAFLLRRRDQNRGYMDQTPAPESLGIERNPRGDVPLELSGGKAYSRGAGVLHMLRRELGDEVFRKGLAYYVTSHRDRTVTSEDLRRAMEEVAGRDLGWFFDPWVYGVGYPRLDVTYDGGARRLLVRQTQPQKGGQGLFRLHVPVRWGANGEVADLFVYREHQVFPVKETGPWLRVGVDGDLLARITVHQDLRSWKAMLAGEPDVNGRLDAAEALEEFGPLARAPLAHALLEDDSWAVRKQAAEILGRLGGSVAVEALVGATRDEDPRVAEAAVGALGSSTREAVGTTVAILAKADVHPYVRAAAARVVGRLKVDGARSILRALLDVESHNDVVRSGALEGLQHLGDPAGVELAMPYLDYCWGKGGTHAVRKAALDCVTHLAPDDRGVHARIVALLDDPFGRMRSWAAQACGTYRIREAKTRLEAVAAHDANGGVRGAAKEALKRLDG